MYGDYYFGNGHVGDTAKPQVRLFVCFLETGSDSEVGLRIEMTLEQRTGTCSVT